MKLSNFYNGILLILSVFAVQTSFAQLPDGFDIKKAYKEAKEKGIDQKIIDEYVNKQHGIYLRAKKASSHNHINNAPADLGTIYKSYNSTSYAYRGPSVPNSPQNAYCPNAGFEQFNFTNWTGATGDVSTGPAGAAFPNFTQTGTSIVNPDGNNVSMVNPNNYHTIMTTPATNSIYPNCVGYDSVAVRVVGTQSVSEIPFVNPSGGPASVRLNGWYGSNDVGSKITYNMTLNPNNKSFSVSYALVLNSGGHLPNEQPYFSVKVRDQNGNLVPGCSQYTITIDDQVTTPGSPSYDPSWKESIHGFNDIYYRPWSTYAFDFSNYPTITSVTVEFYVGGCSLSGHFGYAYVDAECSTGGALASFCNGATSAVVNVPSGFSTYQWTGPGGPVSAANGGTSSSATVSPVSAGDVFTCVATSANGCTSTFPTTISITQVSVTGVGSTPSCPNGSSGSANVSATGSNLGYNYQWVNSIGATISSSQSASGLAPGVYTVNVSSPGCGSASSTVSVGNAPPTFYTQSAPYCGNTAWITNGSGSNHKWYSSTGAAIAGATTPTLTITNPVNGANYILAFTTPSGCRDSIKYTLSQVPGGNIYVSNVASICPGNSNATAVVNLQTTATPAVYSYSVTGPSGYNSVLTNTSATTYSLTNMPIGTFTANVFDGMCLYNTSFTVAPFIYNYTLTPQTPTICTGNQATLTVNFGSGPPTACGLASSGCSSTSTVQVGTATTQGSSGVYTPYGGLYESARNQFLFRASELLAAGVTPGKINKLAFKVTNLNTNSSTFANFTIKLKCVSYATVPTTTMENTGLIQVYGPQTINAFVGWNEYAFTQAYEWDGTSNILVDVCFFNTSWDGNLSVEYTNVGYTSTKYVNADGINQCPVNTVDATDTNRPNVRFGNCLSSAPPSAFSYTWSPTLGLNPTNTYTTVANPSVTTIYTVQVEPIGQANCVQAQSSTVTVTSPAMPTITAVSAMCSNAPSFSLSALPVGGTWSVTPATSATGVFTPSLASIGNNTVTYNYGGVGCLQTTTAIVPVERYVPSTISGTIVPQCITNPSINLSTALSTSTLGVGTWSGNGVAGTTFDPASAGVGTHTITYSTNSVPSGICPSSSVIAVSVSSVTQPTLSAAGPYCTSFPVQTMTANPTGGIWSAVTTGAGIAANGNFTPATSVIGNNTLLYTLTNGPCVKTESVTINVVKFIPATLNSILGPYCVYEPTVALQPIAANFGGTWSGTGVSSGVFNPNTAGVGSHVVTYSVNPSPSGLCPDAATTTIVVNPKPEANITSDKVNGCAPTDLFYQTTTVNNGVAVWDFGDGDIGTGLSTSHTYTNPGTYTAILTYTDAITGCKDTTIAPFTVTIYEVPEAQFEASPDVASVVDAEVHFNNTTVDSNNDYTYLWNIGNQTTSTETSPMYLFTNSGVYTVTLVATSIHNCIDTVIKIVTINPDVVLYVPNAFTPGVDGLNDEFAIALPPTGVDYATFNLTIFNRWGSVVYKTNDVNKFWNGSLNNSGPTLQEGVYVWKISFMDEKKKYYEKVGHVSVIHK